jgi:hypothetical protein
MIEQAGLQIEEQNVDMIEQAGLAKMIGVGTIGSNPSTVV